MFDSPMRRPSATILLRFHRNKRKPNGRLYHALRQCIMQRSYSIRFDSIQIEPFEVRELASRKILVDFFGGSQLLHEHLRTMAAREEDLDLRIRNRYRLPNESDIVLVDWLDATEANLKDLSSEAPDSKIVVINSVADGARLLVCVRCGVMAFVLWDAGWKQTLAAIRKVAEGDRVIPEMIAVKICEHLQGAQHYGPSSLPGEGNTLTVREQAIVQLIAAGMTNQEIADDLCIALQTVKTHVRNVLQKLQCNRRAEVMTIYWRQMNMREEGK